MENKWAWKMDYCWVNKIPPAQKWAWDRAENVYNHSNVMTHYTELLSVKKGNIKK